MKFTEAGLELLNRFESCKLKAYKDVGGVWTIGYGSTGPEIKEGLVWTEEQAEKRRNEDIGNLCAAVEHLIKVDLNDNQFSALVTFAYNVGINAFRKSTMLKLINQNKLEKASEEFLKWVLVKGTLVAGLLRRRSAEQELFLS